MKKLMLLFLVLFGLNMTLNAQEYFLMGTRKGGDGYITAGWMKKGWGLYAGLPHSEILPANGVIPALPGVNTRTGAITQTMKYGILRQLKEDKAVLGFGLQPVDGENRANVFLMYNPFRPSNVINLYGIGNITGSQFTLGLALSYKPKK